MKSCREVWLEDPTLVTGGNHYGSLTFRMTARHLEGVPGGLYHKRCCYSGLLCHEYHNQILNMTCCIDSGRS